MLKVFMFGVFTLVSGEKIVIEKIVNNSTCQIQQLEFEKWMDYAKKNQIHSNGKLYCFEHPKEESS